MARKPLTDFNKFQRHQALIDSIREIGRKAAALDPSQINDLATWLRKTADKLEGSEPCTPSLVERYGKEGQ